MKKIVIPFLIIVFFLSFVDDTTAQRRGKKKRPKKEDTEEKSSSRDRDEDDFEGNSISDKLNIEIKPGNLQFFGNQLSLSLKSNVGYKFNNTFTAGAGGKLFYDFLNNFNGFDDISAFSFGGMVFARAKITQMFYLQAEYSLVSFGSISTVRQETLAYPLAGIGYMQQGYDWSFGIEVLAILNDDVRNKPQGSIVEYWLNFSKNF